MKKTKRTLAHLSDLHLGRDEQVARSALRLLDAILDGDVDHVVVTGDLTHGGGRDELSLFDGIFGDLRDSGRLTIVPGNHDRLGDDVGRGLMSGERVDVVRAPGLYLIRVDSTGHHNRFLLAAHGEIDESVLNAVDQALDGAREDELVAIALHHHPVPLPEENLFERVATRFGARWAAELRLGRSLLRRAAGRADVVLHGHRHVPRAFSLSASGRSLGVYNAGSSTALGRFRVFTHEDGALVGAPSWHDGDDGEIVHTLDLRATGTLRRDNRAAFQQGIAKRVGAWPQSSSTDPSTTTFQEPSPLASTRNPNPSTIGNSRLQPLLPVLQSRLIPEFVQGSNLSC